jgi:hypothetical protein
MCGSAVHKGHVHFRVHTPEKFLRCTEGRFEVERRADAFGWFGMDIRCCGCGHDTKRWAGYETA